MKKSLLLLFSLLIFVGNVWGDCTPLNDTSTWEFKRNTSKTYTLSYTIPSGTLTYSLYLAGSCTGTITIKDDNGNTLDEFSLYSLADKLFSKTISRSLDLTGETKEITFSIGSGTLTKKISNVVVTQKQYLNLNVTELDFGDVVVGGSSSATKTITYSAMSATVSSNKTGIFVVNSPVGNANCGVYGTEDLNVTFNPQTPGEVSGTITLTLSNNKTKTFNVKGTGVLAAPTDFTVEGRGYDYALLKWTGSIGAEKYNIYSGSTLIGKTNNNSTTVKIEGLSLGTTYSNVVVKAVANNTESAASNDVTFSTYDLDKPQNLSSDASYALVSLFWGSVTDATGYRIYNLTNGTYNDIDLSTTVEGVVIYSESGLTANTEYIFKVVPMYGTSLSKSEAEIPVKTTDLPPVPPTQACELHRDDAEYNIDAWKDVSKDYEFGSAMYKCDITFNAKYAIVALWELKKNTNLQAKVGNSWQTIWEEGDKITDSYQEFKVSLPDGTTAVRFYTGGFYNSTQRRYYSGVVVKRRNELSVSDESINFGTPYIGQSVERSLSINYSNIADMEALIDGDDAFTANLTTSAACAQGTGNQCVVTYQPITLDAQQAASLSIYNGKTETVSLTGGVQKLPAPTNFHITGQTPISTTLEWADVNITETGYKVVCKQGDNIIGTPQELGKDATSCTFSNLTPDVEYTYVITAMYEDFENNYATIENAKTDPLAKPVASISANNSKNTISIEWGEVSCAESYTIYKDGAVVASGVTELSYQFTGLDEATEYEFSVKAVRGEAESEVSEAVRATTYTTSMATETTGIFGNKGTVSVTSTAWNEGEKSYAIGSKATVAVSSLPANCEVESIVANGVDVTTTAQFEVLAANSVVVTYHYTGSGIAEVVVDGEEGVIYETLTGAVDAADNGDIINLLGDVDDNMTVSEKSISFNGNGHKINNLYIKEDGNVELTGDVTVVQDFGLEISAENSGQFIEDGGQIEVKGKAYIDKTLDPSGVSKERIWYSVSVPFPVSYNDGVYLVDGNGTEKLLTFNKDFIIKEYDGDLRAASTTKPQGWVMPTTDDMVPGKFYLLGIARNGMNVFRFYKKSDAKLVTENKTLELKKHTSDNPLNAGWNGVGNSQLYHVGIEDATYRFAQALVGGKFVVVDFEKDALSVTTPMFIQTEEDGSVSLSKKSDGTLRSASAGSDIYNLRLTAEGEASYSDQMFASASSEATGNYTIGSDLAKFEISTAYPQIYTRAFNTNLCVHQAAYNEAGVAEMPLYLFTPAAGNYTLSLGSDVLDGTALVLVKDGAEIHNFNADGDYNLYLAKGTDSSYALRIKGENSDIATPVTDDKAENVKVYVKDGVLAIEGLASGSSYAVGNVVRTLYSGVSNGADIKITLTEKGVYWVKAGEMSVKVLNK